MVKVFGPDGREWSIARLPDPPGPLRSVLPGGTWVVEASASDETRRWRTTGRRAAGELVTDVALALRTGAEGPAGELHADGSSADDPGAP